MVNQGIIGNSSVEYKATAVDSEYDPFDTSYLNEGEPSQLSVNPSVTTTNHNLDGKITNQGKQPMPYVHNFDVLGNEKKRSDEFQTSLKIESEHPQSDGATNQLKIQRNNLTTEKNQRDICLSDNDKVC